MSKLAGGGGALKVFPTTPLVLFITVYIGTFHDCAIKVKLPPTNPLVDIGQGCDTQSIL